MKKTSIVVSLLFIGLTSLFAGPCGDVDSNGSVSIVDALLVAKYYVNGGLSNFDKTVADVNNDKRITIVDALLIAQYYVKAINSLSCPTKATETPDKPTPVVNPGKPDSSLIGFASINGGTTGGAGGKTVTVSSASDFINYISRPEHYIIKVSGTINLPENKNTDEARYMHKVASNKTIIGIGSSAKITGCGLKIGINVDKNMTSPPSNAVHNVIIRNITFSEYKDDGINVQMFSHHIWIDHCTFTKGFDGALDIKRGSNYCTVSWNHFKATDKNCLLGHSDSNGKQDKGRLKVTYHHNWFDRTIQRNPRVRFGEAHIFNNYAYENNSYVIGAGDGCNIYAEANYIYNTVKSKFKVLKSYGGSTATFTKSNIVIADRPAIEVNNGQGFNPSKYYKYSVDDASKIPDIVKRGAGVGKI